MALLATMQPGLAGATLSYSLADVAGDTFFNDGETLLLIRNLSGGSINVTITPSIGPIAGVSFAAKVYVLASGAVPSAFGPFPVEQFSALVSVTYSAVTSVGMRPVRIG